MKRLAAIPIALMLAGLLTAQAPAPRDSVTVTGERGRMIESFIASTTTPTRMTGKMARWETPICPSVLGAEPGAAQALLTRLRAVALEAGVKVHADPACEPNIRIVFTDTPQVTLDNVRVTQPDLLGFADNDEAREKLAQVTRPIQGWYATATRDLDGMVRVDAPVKTKGGELWVLLPCQLTAQYRKPAGPGGVMFIPPPGKMCQMRLSEAQQFNTAASRVSDGLRSIFDHILIVADETRLAGQDAGAVNDYVALLALAQLSALDGCQSMPSIVNLLPPGCQQVAQSLTSGDMGYLKGLYSMNAELMAQGQKHAVARSMETAMAEP